MKTQCAKVDIGICVIGGDIEMGRRPRVGPSQGVSMDDRTPSEIGNSAA